MTEAQLSAKVTADIADFNKRFAEMHTSIDRLKQGADSFAIGGNAAASLAQVDAAVKNTGKGIGISIRGGLDQASGAITNISAETKFAAGAITGVASAVEGTFFGIAKTVSASTEKIAQISQQTGIEASTLESWQPVLNRTGTSITSFAQAYKALSKDIVAAQEGNQKAIDKFAAMGLAVNDLGSTNAVIEALADRIASMTDPAARAQLAVDLLGKAGLGLIPALSGGSQGLQESANQARAFGLVLSAVQRDQLLKFDDSLDDIGSAFTGFKDQVALSVTPALQAIADMVTGAIQWFSQLNGGVKEVLAVFGTAFTAGGSVVLAAAGAAAALGIAFTPILVGGATVIAIIAAAALIVAHWKDLKAGATSIWNSVRDVVVGAVEKMVAGVDAALGKLKGIMDGVRNSTEAVKGFFYDMWTAVTRRSYVPDMVADIEANMDQLPSKMIPQARRAVTQVKNIFAELESIQTTPGAAADVGRQVQSLDLSQSSGQRAALANTIKTIETGKFTYIQAQNEMASVATQTWGGITSTVSGAFAQQILNGNNWAATLNQLGIMMLSNFTNLALQMATQWLFSNAVRTASDQTAAAATVASSAISAGAVSAAAGTMAAANTAAAATSTAVWSAAGTAIIGFFGTIAGGFTAIAAGLVAAVTAVGTFVAGVMSAIAAALSATIFGIPVGVAVAAAVVGLVAALAATDNLPSFAKGGISFGPAIFGEAGPEAAIPLNARGASFMQEAFGMGGGSSAGGPMTIVLEVDGEAFATIMTRYMPGVLRRQRIGR